MNQEHSVTGPSSPSNHHIDDLISYSRQRQKSKWDFPHFRLIFSLSTSILEVRRFLTVNYIEIISRKWFSRCWFNHFLMWNKRAPTMSSFLHLAIINEKGKRTVQANNGTGKRHFNFMGCLTAFRFILITIRVWSLHLFHRNRETLGTKLVPPISYLQSAISNSVSPISYQYAYDFYLERHYFHSLCSFWSNSAPIAPIISRCHIIAIAITI